MRRSGHAKEQLSFGGTTEEEVIEAIGTAPWQSAELSRMEWRKNFAFQDIRNKNIIK